MAKGKICLDAGHYGKYNRSPANKAYYESDMNWKLHLLLKKYLEQKGFEVILTRDKQENDLGLTTRGKKSKGCDLFLSIHSNAVGDYVKESVDFPVVYVPLNGTGDKIGRLLADTIADVMDTVQKAEVMTRKGNNGDYYGVIRGAVSVGTPGLILEHSFHTNTRSTHWLLDDGNLDDLAKAEAKVIAEYFGSEKEEEKPVKEEKIVVVELNQLSKGSKGEQVKTLQRLLKALGFKDQYGAALAVDGSFGSKTDYAVKAFQKAEKLDVDGYVGKNTWSALLK
jgi:N-acetylmuramoyl-L-alanine amidase/sulfur carrier protein ThiS